MSLRTNMLSRQPTELDYADPTKFKFGITQLPKVEFFTVAANLPAVSLGESTYSTPFKEISLQGDQMTFENLEITFLVDEKLENYIELHNWMVGIGFPKARTQFESFRSSNTSFPTGTPVKGESTKPGSGVADTAMYGDATLTVTSSKNNPVVEVRFADVYPTSLSGLQYNQQESDITYLTATCTFAYKIYEIFTL